MKRKGNVTKLSPKSLTPGCLHAESKETEVALDTVYVEDQAFIHVVNRKVKYKWKAKYKSLACMGRKRKLTDNEPFYGVYQIIHLYKQEGIKVMWFHLDSEFKLLKERGDKCWKLRINLLNPDEHVPDTKRSNCLLQK